MSATLAADTGVWRTSDHYASRARRLSLLVGAVALVIASVYAAAIVATDGDRLLLIPLIGAVVVLSILAHPVVGVYVLLSRSA
ncbi:MAG: hypothetical protein E6I18_05080 [Chloroflexi bacterium]|nr:MAG: hypothetical protein E6I18_05080 [Chloroflexota bacterium]